MNHPPAVSVIMAVYNAAPYLNEAITSILAQTLRDFELICVDDGSRDNSKEILLKFAHLDPRIRVVSRANTGPSAARNDAIGLARGDLIAIMDADDVSLPTRLENQAEHLRLNSDVVCVGSEVLVIDQDGDPLDIFRVPLSHQQIDSHHLERGQGGAIMHSAAMIRTCTLKRIGGYREIYQPAEDLDLWLRIAEVGSLANLGKVLVKYRMNPTGLSSTKRSVQNRNANAAVLEARERRGILHLPPPNNNWDPDPVGLLRAAVYSTSREGFWKSARKYARRLIWHQPLAPLGWRILAQSLVPRPPSRNPSE